jgi:hypothetical protein
MDSLRSIFLAYISTSDAPSIEGFTACARAEGFSASFVALFLEVVSDVYPAIFAVLR